MDFRMPEGVEEFRREVREFIVREWRPDPTWTVDSEEFLAADVEFRRKLGEKGWLGMALPKEYGGQEMPILYQYVFQDELSYYHAPDTHTACSIVAPTLVKVGSEDQKKRILPRITSGEIEFCLGYTEPSAGSDLASLEIRAVEDGDDYVINGAKIFTTLAHRAQYAWLAARTDPDVPKHKGISLFLVNMKSPGITVKALWTMGGTRTNRTYWDDVRVPKANLVGELNRGWYYMTTALDFERIAIAPIGNARALFDRIVAYVREASVNGKPLRDDPEVQDKIGRLSADIEVAQMISYRTAWLISQGIVPNYESSMLKITRGELLQRLAQLGTQIMGLYGQLQPGSKYAPVDGSVENEHRTHVVRTIAGGANEIQRNVIAQRGLGLPR